jgi:myo-inositol 2-dehydrogenase/D-chiro-inositol 1-dehydrogenase
MNTRTSETGIRLGIIGAGRVTTDHHLPALRRLPHIQAAALADVDAARLQQIADRFGIPSRYTDPQALLADPTLQAVAICTPPPTHAGLALAALAAGKHVLIEKPLALRLRECDQLQARASTLPGQQVTVGFNLRWHRLMVAASELVRAGAVGHLQALHLTLTSGYRHRRQSPLWRNQRQSGGSVLLEIGSHLFDLARFLAGAEFAEVHATAQSRDGLETMATVNGRMANGSQVSLLMGDHSADILEVDIFGNAGRLHVSGYRFDGLELWPVLVYPGSLKARVRQAFETVRGLPGAWPSLRQGGDFASSYRKQWQRFGDRIANGQTAAPTLEDGRQSLRAALAGLHSLRTGQPASLAAIADDDLEAGLA